MRKVRDEVTGPDPFLQQVRQNLGPTQLCLNSMSKVYPSKLNAWLSS